MNFIILSRLKAEMYVCVEERERKGERERDHTHTHVHSDRVDKRGNQ